MASSLTRTDLIPRVCDFNKHKSDMLNYFNERIVWYTIGPSRLAKHFFTVHINLHSASKLGSLIPVDQILSTGDQTGFYFTFDLCGKSIYTKRFDDLNDINLSTEKHIVYVK